MTVLPPDIYQDFVEEASEILKEWERHCLDLESQYSKEACESLSRSAHNLKGTSRAMNLIEFSEFVHLVEDLVENVTKKKIKITPQVIELLLKSQELMLCWLVVLPSNPQFVPHEDKEKISSLVKKYLESEKKSEDNSEFISQLLDSESSQNSSSTLSSQSSANSQTHAPNAEENGSTELKTTIDQIRSDKTQSNFQSKSLRVPTEKIDKIARLAGELSIHNSIVSHSIFSSAMTVPMQTQSSVNMMSKLIREIQSYALSLRMQPISELFQRLERTAKDIARKQNKVLDITTEGSHNELDKTVIERIGDSLVHIVRNAVDHGIETEEERKKTGKNPRGRISLKATMSIKGLLVSIADDGKGLDAQKIQKKAIEKGYLSPDKSIKPHEAFQFIFYPGFSTAEKITDISGRGIGMDVLKSAIEEIGGQLELESEKGVGTTFNVSLPTSLNIIDALLVYAGKSVYAVPLQDLSEIIDLTDFETHTVGEKNIIYLRGCATPVALLQKLLPRLCYSAFTTYTDMHNSLGDFGKIALVVKMSERTVAFQIDGIMSNQPIVVRQNIGDLLALQEISGTTILGNGEPGLIINLPYLAKTIVSNQSLERLEVG